MIKHLTQPADASAAVFCACGAQWHGRAVQTAAFVIAIHERRASHECRIISHEQFRQQFPCSCAPCKAARAATFRAKHPRGPR